MRFREMRHLMLSRLGLFKRSFRPGATDDFNWVVGWFVGSGGVVGEQPTLRWRSLVDRRHNYLSKDCLVGRESQVQ